MFLFLFANLVARSKKKYASMYHCDSRLLIKKVPAPRHLPHCPMSPYNRVFHDFACLRFLGINFKSIYHCVSPKLQHPGGLQILSCFRVLLCFWSIEFVQSFCKYCRSIKDEARASWLSAEKETAPKRLASCPMSAYYRVFYDFAFFEIFPNFVARSKQKCASIYHCGSRLLIKKAPAPKRLPQCPMWP